MTTTYQINCDNHWKAGEIYWFCPDAIKDNKLVNKMVGYYTAPIYRGIMMQIISVRKISKVTSRAKILCLYNLKNYAGTHDLVVGNLYETTLWPNEWLRISR